MTLGKENLKLLQNGKILAAEIAAENTDCRAWVAVIHVRENTLFAREHPETKFIIQRIEVSNYYLDQFWNHDLDLVYDHCHIHERYFASDEDEVEEILGRWLSDINQLTQSWKLDYPF